MKWLLYAGLALLVAGIVLIGGLLLFVPVSVPLPGILSSLLPGTFDAPRAEVTLVRSRLAVPAPYGLTLFAADVRDARMLRVTPAGDVIVTSTDAGTVWLLSADRDGDGVSDGRKVLLEGLDGPNGLDIRDGRLYVGETGRIVSVAFDAQTGTVTGTPAVFADGLPPGGNHWRKPLRFGPDGLLYVVVGSSCNVCLEEDERRAAMLRYAPDGRYLGVFATGLRNSAGFDWRDEDGALYATDNGRDLLGDDFPPCELNLVREGGFYGWPFANGNRIADPDFGEGREAVIEASIPPVFEFRAHNAPLGIVFLRSAKHPDAYRGAAVVALHGSWNRREKDGYKVVSLHWRPDGTIESRDFLTGFLGPAGDVIGRPAEVAEDADGNIYVSDDYANAVYRVSPGGPGTLPAGVLAQPTVAPVGAGGPRPMLEEAERAAGAAQFEALACATCHRADTGEPVAEGRVALRNLAQRYTEASLAAYLRRPNPPMPPVVQDDEIVDALARYLLATY